jgi:IclR family transcriptional regulator, pca regulon regulatory protein
MPLGQWRGEDTCPADPSAQPGAAGQYFVKSLERGIAVLRVFSRDRPEATRSDVAQATGLSRAAARRFLLTLADLSYVRTDGRNFRLTAGVLRLGYAYLASHPLVQLSQRRCEALALELRESVCVWVPEGTDAVCVVHVPAARILAVSVSVGTRVPLTGSAAGRVLQAAQASPDEQGASDWAVAEDDPEEGIRTIAVPVRDETGRCVAAVALTAHGSRMSAAAARRQVLAPLRETARALAADLAAGPAIAVSPGGSRRTRPEPGPAAVGAHFVQSLGRGLAVIRAFIGGPPELTLTEVSRATALTRAAARRSLLTLRDLGYVRADGGQFELTPRVLELGYAYLSGLSLTEVAEPRLEQLAADVGASASLAILDGYAVVYLTRVAATRVGTVSVSAGTRMPAWATAIGRVLLAELPAGSLDSHLAGLELRRLARRTITSQARLRAEIGRARDQGWALVDSELEDGLRALAVAVRNRNGDAVAAVSVATMAGAESARAMRDGLLPPLLETARLIESDLRVAGSSSTHRVLAAAWR